MVPHFSLIYVKDFFISLFDPTDHSLNIPVELREHIYKYTLQTGLMVYLTLYMFNPLTKHNYD